MSDVWSVRDVPMEARSAATAAAKRAGMTTGEWIGRAVLAYVKDSNTLPAVIPAAPAPVDLSEIERMVAMAAQLAAAAGKPVPRSIARPAFAILRSRLEAAK